MRQASGPALGARFALKPGVALHVMADGSGVLADPALGEAHALNADAVDLVGPDRVLTLDVAAGEADRFVEQLNALGLIEVLDG